MAASFSSQSRTKIRPVVPIQIDRDGCPFGPHYDALSDRISRHVYHNDEFFPALTWPTTRTQAELKHYIMSLTLSCVMLY